MPACRDGSAPMTLIDLMGVIAEVEGSQGVTIHWTTNLAGLGGADQRLEIRLIADPASNAAPHVVRNELAGRWPTNMHKSYIGLLYFMLLRMDMELEAGKVFERTAD